MVVTDMCDKKDIWGIWEHCWAPKEYEKILKLQYGNWKELPPEDERGGHGDIIVDLNKDYKEYF